MIDLSNIGENKPNLKFKQYYLKALDADQKVIQGMAISTFNKDISEVDCRYVNLKYVIDDEWIFFTNYKSQKAKAIETHSQIAAVFYWSKINTQIRMKGTIKKASEEFSDYHFSKRSAEKNALALSSNQSSKISSYEKVEKNFLTALSENSLDRPDFWGGYAFKPNYFEFWTGHNSRLNKREVFELKDNDWDSFILQP